MSQLISRNDTPSGSTPRSEVVRHVMQGIQTGAYGVGQPLPSARQLSRDLGVDRRTVGRAFELLEDDGFVRSDKNGIRIVVSGTSDDSGLLGQSIAVLAHGPAYWPKGHYQPGWGDFLDRGILDRIHESELHAVSLNPKLLSWDTVAQLLQSRPQGVVVSEEAASSPRTMEMLESIRDGGLPVVAYGDSPQLQTFDRVTSDHKSGARMLTSWLISQGCRRVLMLQAELDKDSYWAKERTEGYKVGLADANLPAIDPVNLPPTSHGYDRETLADNTRLVGGYLLEFLTVNPVDAILCASDGLVFPVAEACKLAGKEPNKDVYVVGYDNYWQDSPERRHTPFFPAATVDKRNHEIGSELVNLLLERLEGKLPDEPQRRAIEPKLIVIDPDEA